MSGSNSLIQTGERPPAENRLRQAVFGLSGMAGVLGSAAIVIITLGLALDVLLRTLRGQGINGMIDAVGPLLAIAAFLGLGMTEAKGEHIALSLFVKRLGVRARFALYILGTAVTMLMVAWIIWAGYLQAVHSIEIGEVRPGIVNIPTAPARIAVVVGAAILLIQMALTLVDAVRGFVTREPKGVWVDRENE